MGAIALAFTFLYLITRQARVITVSRNPPSSPDGKTYFKFISQALLNVTLSEENDEDIVLELQDGINYVVDFEYLIRKKRSFIMKAAEDSSLPSRTSDFYFKNSGIRFIDVLNLEISGLKFLISDSPMTTFVSKGIGSFTFRVSLNYALL